MEETGMEEKTRSA